MVGWFTSIEKRFSFLHLYVGGVCEETADLTDECGTYENYSIQHCHQPLPSLYQMIKGELINSLIQSMINCYFSQSLNESFRVSNTP